VSHAEAFRPLIDYALAHPCTRCKAPAWAYCVAPRKASANALTHRLHARRQDHAIWHYYRDVGNAPWPEAREPGRCYSTIPPRPIADTDLNGANISAPTPRLTTPTADAGQPAPFWRELIPR
jgi:hypothetical protein